MSFQQGLSGLNAAAKNLDVIGNNVANSGTVGFKSSQAEFADVYAASLMGAGSSQTGLGTKVTTIAQQFTQGNVSSTNNPLDVAITGKGFFRLSNSGEITYSRNGQFQLDKSGFIVSSAGLRLTGYQVDASANPPKISGALGDMQLNTADINPHPTTLASPVVNLDSGSTPITIPWPATLTPVVPATVPPTYNQPSSSLYNSSTPTSVYDSQGNSHAATLYFTKTAANTWDVHSIVDGGINNAGQVLGVTPPVTPTAMTWAAGVVTATAPGAYAVGDTVNITGVIPAGYNGAYTVTSVGPGTFTYALSTDPVGAATTLGSASTNDLQLVFNPSGQLIAPVVPPAMTVGQFAPETIAWNPALGVAAQTLTLNFSGTTQFGSPFGVNSLTQDGFASGRLAGFNVGIDGMVLGRYTNGQTKTMGQVALANFANPQGLQALGDNQWAESPTSGQALVGVPGTSSLGTLQAGAVEDSNVDLTAELVNMITAQRAYQANAQTIKTQDSIMQTIVNLR